MADHLPPVFLGIDCGTSKVAVAVIDAAGGQLHAASQAHHADLPAPAGRHEQDACRIIGVAEALVQALPTALRQRVAALGFTGQMHGVVLHDAGGNSRSPLVTWQDRRALEEPSFLPSLGRPLHAGYGMATLAWWARSGGVPPGTRAATIHGLLAARWSGRERAAIDPTDAQAWGGVAPLPGLAGAVLPEAVDHGAVIGRLQRHHALHLGLSGDLPLIAPLGDNQASLRATLGDPLHDLSLTIGTGCQLAAVVPRAQAIALGHAERRPYDAEHDLIVAAPLCGGAAWRWLAQRAAAWVGDLTGAAPELETIYARLDGLGMAADDALTFAPHLAGERHDATLSGSLGGLRLDNGSLGQLARAVARGIVANACKLLPAAARHGRTRVVASGNALRRSELLRTMAVQELGLPLLLGDWQEEAATGAAMVAADASARADRRI